MNEKPFDRKKSRETVLSMTLEDVLREYKDAMKLANKYGDFCFTVYYANKINLIEEIIKTFMGLDEETEGLITEGYGKTDKDAESISHKTGQTE